MLSASLSVDDFIWVDDAVRVEYLLDTFKVGNFSFVAGVLEVFGVLLVSGSMYAIRIKQVDDSVAPSKENNFHHRHWRPP